jgi:hypothetical protein
MKDPFKPAGFTEALFAAPFDVTAFPESLSWEPTPCKAIGTETCNQFGSVRLIVRYDSPPRRKVSGLEGHWPNHLLYLAPRDVSGWEPAKKESVSPEAVN